MREVCGSVSGMVMLAGLIKPASDPSVKEWRTANYALVQEMAEDFRKFRHSEPLDMTEIDSIAVGYGGWRKGASGDRIAFSVSEPQFIH